MSFFITFEGIEGSGKTTQIHRLRDALKLRGYDVVSTREPGGTSIGDEIRHILLDSENNRMEPLAELFLYAAARSQHVYEVIVPALKEGKIVLCDRFIDATHAYQGAARGFSDVFIQQLNQMTVGAYVPNLTILMDCDPEIGLSRANNRIARIVVDCPKEDRFEKEATDFHRKVREGYLRIANQEPNRFLIVDALQRIDKIQQIILGHVLKALEK